MRTMILAGAAALALAVPAAAQDTVAVDAEGDVLVLSDDQQVLYDTWPPERRTMYDAWPDDLKVYYWTLPPEHQEGWWVLTDDQRTRVYAMTPAQRAAAWTEIAAQLSGAAPATSASTASMSTRTSAGTGNKRFVSNAMVQDIPMDTPATSPPDQLPVCKPMQQDGCINSWEKNKTGTKPLNYWPGKPASEIDEPLPAEKPGA